MRALGMMAAALLMAGCTVKVDEALLMPAPPAMGEGGMPSMASLPALLAEVPPEGQVLENGAVLRVRAVQAGRLGRVQIVQIDREAAVATLIVSGGLGWLAGSDPVARLTALAAAAEADLLVFERPDADGVHIWPTVEALERDGPRLVAALRGAGLVEGPLIAHGFSLGGAKAVALAGGQGKKGRNDRLDGVIIETAAPAMGRLGEEMLPGMLKPFVKLRLEDEMKPASWRKSLKRAGVPVLVLAANGDRIATPALMQDLGRQLMRDRVAVSMVSVSAGHAAASETDAGAAAVRDFVTQGR
jgi:pimeloyl-ACP methyl ester carboxylesterase